MLVVDASVLVPALVDDGADGETARRRLWGEALAAPHLVDLELVSVLRRLTRAGLVSQRRSAAALADVIDLPMQRAPHLPLLPRC